MKKQLLISATILFFLFSATTLVVMYGKGYRFWFDKGKPDISGTGLLVATSDPDGAQVFVNGNLTTATDSTINLAPGEYTVRIFKEGYFPWEKKLSIQNEVVTKADAVLFSKTPKLENITTLGVENPILSPSLAKIAYTVASQSAQKNGVYILDMTNRPVLTLQSASTQITDDLKDNFSISNLQWAPDGKTVLASISASINNIRIYALSDSGFNENPRNVTNTIQLVLEQWEKDKIEKNKSLTQNLKPALRNVIANDFSNISWSPDETKILYTASSSATIPQIIKPPLIGTNQTPESRNLQEGSVYVYDTKEDKNYKILNSYSPNLQWFPDSEHLIYTHDKKIDVMEYDGQNITTVYAGPFVNNYVFPYSNTSKIVILTDLGNPANTPNLYTVGLK